MSIRSGASRHANICRVMLPFVLVLGLLPVAAFWPPITTTDDFVSRLALFGFLVALIALVGHTFSLPHLPGTDENTKWGALKPDQWGKLVRWSSAFSAVIGLGISVFLVPALTR